MDKYTIKINGRKAATIEAESADAAARKYSEQCGPDSEYGFARSGAALVDADTRGIEWAILKTDGGCICADKAAGGDGDITWTASNSSSFINGTREAKTILGAVRAAIRYANGELAGEGKISIYEGDDEVRRYEAGMLAGTARGEWKRVK